MKKRLFALLLALCLLPMPALAAQDSTDNFVRRKTYAGQFSDLAADSMKSAACPSSSICAATSSGS